MPARTFSPGLRARTKTARSCCRDEAGKKRSWCMTSVTQPSAPVGASAGIVNCENGIASASTSAPCTARPLHAETWKRTGTSVVEREITEGETVWPSISRRAGAETLPTSAVPEPLGHPVPARGGVEPRGLGTPAAGGGAPRGWKGSVAFEVAVAEPSALRAVTRTRSVLPWSAPRTRYDDESAPPMFAQPLPCVLQRRHWYAYEIVLALVQVPVDAVSVSPTWAVPVILGSAVLTGAALLAASESPATASTVTAAAASSARRFDLRVMVPLLLGCKKAPSPFRRGRSEENVSTR